MFDEEYKTILKRMYVDNIEYEFFDEGQAQRFINKLLSESERLYKDEHYYHKYKGFKDFLYSSEVDRIAYSVFYGDYGSY